MIRLKDLDGNGERRDEENTRRVFVIKAIDEHIVISATRRQGDLRQVCEAAYDLHLSMAAVLYYII